jgi:hypothetical protein
MGKDRLIMALSKKITDNRGIVANYHKIYSVINNGGDLTVEVHGYASEDYRNKENNAKKLFERQFEIGVKLSELSAIPVEKRTKEDTETIEKLFAESENPYNKPIDCTRGAGDDGRHRGDCL